MTDGLPDVLDDPWGGCNPLDPGFRADPYPRLARLRERDPVNLTPIGFWRLLRYDDVVRAMSLLSNAGAPRIGLVTEPPGRR